MSVTVFDLDDLCDDFNPWDELHALKERYPNLKVTLFAIPGRCSPELLEQYRQVPWIELGVHGYHHSSQECATWSYEEATEKLKELEGLGWSRLFKAPGWVANEQVYEALMDLGWVVADNIKMCDGWGKAQPARYVYNVPGEFVAVHGHTWDCMENGPSDWERLFAEVPEDAQFAFVSEVCGETPPKTYLWGVLDEMDLRPGDLFVDCGAYDGAEIEVLQPRGVRVLSFEPHPDRFAALSQRWGGVEGVEVVGAAVGTKAGRVRLYESDAFDSGSSVSETKMAVNRERAFDVDMVRLADALRGREVKVLKLDIEGTEWEVLEDLLNEGVLQKCGQVYVEDHTNRMRNPVTKEVRMRVLMRCAEEGVQIREWV